MNDEEEEEEEEEEKEEEEEEAEEEKVAPVTITVAVLLLGFLVFDMVLLQLVNWDDPNVRSYIYKTISATLSIFCAVLLNGATFALVLAYLPLILGPGPGPKMTPPRHGHTLPAGNIEIYWICLNISFFTPPRLRMHGGEAHPKPGTGTPTPLGGDSYPFGPRTWPRQG